MPESIVASAVSHVAICVRNLEQSLRFYRDLLGFVVSKDELQDTSTGGLPHLYQHWHAQRRVVHLRYGDRHSVPFMVLTEHPGETVSGAPIMLDQVGISHISFTVPDVEALTQRLLAAGVHTCGPADAFRDTSGHLRTVFFRDPDGILVQFDEGGEE
jgi:catechol 2,3-dioxygenase-like lactoylglutathione lyase family enzyme